MPPKKRATNFKGEGRKLGESPAKKRKFDKPLDNGGAQHLDSSDTDEDNEATKNKMPYPDALTENEIEEVEVKDANGRISLVKRHGSAKKSGEGEEGTNDDKLLEAAKASESFGKLTDRRKLRFNELIKKGKANAMMKNQTVLDFSDTANDDPKAKTAMILCKRGRYVPRESSKKGKQGRLEEVVGDELAKLEALDDGSPCACDVCRKRIDNEPAIARGTMRSGNKRGFYKYGEGHTLGEKHEE